MHSAIEIRIDSKRGCGWRKLGGLYFICDDLPHRCGRLPIPCDVCPTCHQGLKPARSYTWVDGDKFKAEVVTNICEKEYCAACPLHPTNSLGKCGLIWIGEQHYKTPTDFLMEAGAQGISRRIPGDKIPRDFEIGKTYILLAHRKTIMTMCECTKDSLSNGDCPVCNGDGVVYTPGIFRVFCPSRIECVVSGDEPDEVIDHLVERGLTPVIVKRREEQVTLFQGGQHHE